MTEYEPYGARHFLRRLDTEGASELRRHTIPLQNGQPLDPKTYADVDAFRIDGILFYRTLVLRRSPLASRPPSVYRLVRQDRYYEVWQRPQGSLASIEHLSLGIPLSPGALPRCGDVLDLARRTPVGGILAAVIRRPPLVVSLADTAGWQADSTVPGAAFATESRVLKLSISVPQSGRYGLWLGGSIVGSVTIAVDGRALASERARLNWSGHYEPFGDLALSVGAHEVTLTYRRGGLRPGASAVAPSPLGPLVLARETAVRPVELVAPENARSLCGRALDWVEAVGP